MTLRPNDVENFKTLVRAAEKDRLFLLECRDRATGEYRAVICAVKGLVDGFEFVPLGHIATGNPFEDYLPPDPNDPGGYLTGEGGP